MATDGETAKQRGKSIYALLGAPMDLLQWKLLVSLIVPLQRGN